MGDLYLSEREREDMRRREVDGRRALDRAYRAWLIEASLLVPRTSHEEVQPKEGSR